MTDAYLAAIRERVEAATPGEWHYEDFGEPDYPNVYNDNGRVAVPLHGMEACIDNKADAVFIAHARADVVALLAEVETLKGIIGDRREDAGLLRWQPAPIAVYRFEDAPDELRSLSGHGGDEDWLVVVEPGRLVDATDLFRFCDDGDSSVLGCCSTSIHPLPDGRVVLIGAHA